MGEHPRDCPEAQHNCADVPIVIQQAVHHEGDRRGHPARGQQAAHTLFTNAALDFLLSENGAITEENVSGMSKLGTALSKITAAEVMRSASERLKLRFDAEMERLAKAAGGKGKGLTEDRISEIRKAVFG